MPVVLAQRATAVAIEARRQYLTFSLIERGEQIHLGRVFRRYRPKRQDATVLHHFVGLTILRAVDHQSHVQYLRQFDALVINTAPPDRASTCRVRRPRSILRTVPKQ